MRQLFSRRILNSKDEESNFWPTFTDLLSTILLVILLILLAFIVRKNAIADERKAQLEVAETKIEEQRELLEYYTGLRSDIIADLKKEFEETNLRIEIDPETGAIKFSNDLLFEFGQSTIRPKFKDDLKEFIPTYISTLYERYGEHIAEVVVEGHTDDVGSFIQNLELSQERAFSVVKFIISDDMGDFPYKDQLKFDITANGRSWSELKKSEGEVDRKSSRRVEFKFRLKNEQGDYLLEQVKSLE